MNTLSISAKKAYILILDIATAVLASQALYRDSQLSVSIDWLFLLISSGLLVTRIFFDYGTTTIEELYYQDKVESEMQASRQERERLAHIHERTKAAIARADYAEVALLERLKEP